MKNIANFLKTLAFIFLGVIALMSFIFGYLKKEDNENLQFLLNAKTVAFDEYAKSAEQYNDSLVNEINILNERIDSLRLIIND